eukprot:gb/GECG01003267.1/.p1 GENE.gb/GECG01003267.1/~~gb/GECG01003267.1/.p1  ORF type:complete len:551 (+),score=89.90 gb/GECG01003267.1/:1-1653(+)
MAADQGPPPLQHDQGTFTDSGANINAYNASIGATASAPPPGDEFEPPPHTGAQGEREVPIYPVKRIPYFQRMVPILCQNENGPCPLLAICNVLLLRGSANINADMSYITEDELIQIVANKILESNTGNDDQLAINQQQLIDDAVSSLHKLTRGVDVNVSFTDPQAFEYTRELTPFDLTGIRLFHGWLIDPEDKEAQSVINGSSYNTLVQTLVDSSSPVKKRNPNSSQQGGRIKDYVESEVSEIIERTLRRVGETFGEVNEVTVKGEQNQEDHTLDPSSAYRVSVIRRFLDETATQLTYHGIMKLFETMEERELGILFRNNHFSVIFKYSGYLFLLVTDEGYRDEPEVVWEVLDEIAGDTVFVNGEFKIPAAEQTGASQAAIANSTTEGAASTGQQQAASHGQTGESGEGTSSTYDELVKAQLAMERQAGSAANQPAQANGAPLAQHSRLNQQRFHKSNRERYATQAERLREAHEARQQRQRTQGPPQSSSGNRMRIVQDAEGRLRTASGRLLTDEECARFYQQMENSSQRSQQRSAQQSRNDKKKNCIVM